jgi:hypothetical protein
VGAYAWLEWFSVKCHLARCTENGVRPIPASNIVELASALNFDRWLPDYRVACRRCTPHFCDHRTYCGANEWGSEQLLDGPSFESDFRNPATLSCDSLFQVTSDLLLCMQMSSDGELIVEEGAAKESLSVLHALFMATREKLTEEFRLISG